MKLIECYIENFGKIRQQKFTFADGFNCIRQNNGAGKTTLTIFIKVMLYGMSDTKRQLLSENERRHYLPWNGAKCGGYLIIECGGVRYRIERTFAPKAADDTYRRIEVDTGKECRDSGDSFGTDIFGIDAESFERTVFHSERALASRTENKTISAKLSDLVGTDGDIEGMDEALKRLEEKRKFYQKLRGSGGKISDIHTQISETEDKIAALCRLEEELSVLDTEAERIAREMAELDAKSRNLVEERGRAVLARSQSASAEKLKQVKVRTDELVGQKNSIIDFFSGQVPTVESLEKAKLYHARATEAYERIKEKEPKSEEYTSLCSLFSDKLTHEDAITLRTAVASERAKDSERAALLASRFGELFVKRVPDDEEITLIEQKLTETKKRSHALAIVLSVVAIACGVCGYLLTSYLYAVAGALAIAAAVLIAVVGSKNAKDKQALHECAEEFFFSVMGSVPDSDKQLQTLYEMRAQAQRAPKDETISEARETLSMLVGELGNPDTNVLDETERILDLFDKYERLRIERSIVEDEIKRERSEADRLMMISRSFTLKYKTATDDPFTEIREKLAQYERLTSEIIAAHAEAAGLEAPNIDIGIEKDTKTPEMIDEAIRECDAKRAELERARGANMKRKNECEAALLEKDTLAATLAELTDEYNEAKEDLHVIQLTQKYLTEAREKITSRYLGKTKEYFHKYLELFGTDGEFDMDTTFEVARIDQGEARPIEAYSRGTRELYNLAAKMALCDSLYDGELPFLIFDDPFTAFDDERVKRSLELLCRLAEKRQIIYLTCSQARATDS